MADTRYPTIRYKTLDKCFRNRYKRYYIEDLVEACSDAIYYYSGSSSGCSRRTILNDIDFMESNSGWRIPLKKIKDGRRVYYRYSDPDFSIYDSLLSESDYDKLNEAVTILEKFRGIPCFEWLDELLFKLQNGTRKSSETIFDFEHAPSLKGLNYIDRLFNSILYKQVIEVTYLTYGNKKYSWKIHPYLIKQYNSRWFLFGKNTTCNGKISNVPLDRIEYIEDCGDKYEEDDGSLQLMLDSIVGVTVEHNSKVEDVVLKFSEHRFPYIETKPLHKSQEVIDEEQKIIKLHVMPNKELESLVLQYGNDIEVLKPDWFRNQIKEKIISMMQKY